MKELIAVELAYAVVMAVTFLAFFGLPWRHEDPGMGWHIAGFTFAITSLLALLLAAVLGVVVQLWLAALVLAAVDGVLTWRLVLYIRSKHSGGR